MTPAEAEDSVDAKSAAVVRLQSRCRAMLQGRLARKMLLERHASIANLQQHAVALGGKRVQPWSAESAELALQELNGKHGANGMILWPKGTVERLLVERTKYADVVRKQK
jgi:hypothetical protein